MQRVLNAKADLGEKKEAGENSAYFYRRNVFELISPSPPHTTTITTTTTTTTTATATTSLILAVFPPSFAFVKDIFICLIGTSPCL